MIYSVGSRVRFINTGYEGTVTEMLGDDMLSVLLDDGDEIPAFEEDLMRVEDYRAQLRNKLPVKAKVVKGKIEKQAEKPNIPEFESPYAILKSLGIQLAFEALYKADGLIANFKIYLINDLQYDALYSFNFMLGNQSKLSSNGKLPATAYAELGVIPFDYLNDSPTVEVECWQVTTQGSGKKQYKKLKIKAKQFFKKVKTAPLLNIPVYHYIIFESLEPPQPTEDDLKTYTRQHNKPNYSLSDLRRYDTHSVTALANFDPELDLHIEKLTDKWQKMSNADILRLQLKTFDAYLNKAIEIGVPRVYVIHGLGKGRLRDEIASRLIRHPQVETFKNEYHPRYGYGATEVVL
jgi:hypothetical protein